MIEFLEKLTEFAEHINNGASIDEALDYIFASFRNHIPYERIGIALLDSKGGIYANTARAMNSPSLKAGYSLSLAETSLQWVVSSKQPRIINDYHEYLRTNPNSEPTKLLIEEGILSSIACPLVANRICIGVMFFSSDKAMAYKQEDVAVAKMICNYMGITIEKNLLVDDLILASVTGFAKLVESRDSDTGMHIERIQNYSKVIAKSLSTSPRYSKVLTERYINEIYKFSPLHDIGKVGIPDSILLKPGKLTPEEFDTIKTHTTIGADVLKTASNNLLNKGRHYFDVGIEIVLGHHEKYNGKGYPQGLAGNAIPLSARIVAVADVLDALASKRVYKSAFGLGAAFQIIEQESGKSFDPEVVNAMIRAKAEIVEVYEKYVCAEGEIAAG